jgi:hypothetical protein
MPTESLPGVWCFRRHDEVLPLDLLFGALDADETERLDRHLVRIERELQDLAAELATRVAPRTCPVRDVTITHFAAWGEVQLSLSIGGREWPGGFDLSLSNWFEDDTGRRPGPPYQVDAGIAVHCSTRACPQGGVHDVWAATEQADTAAGGLTVLAALLDRGRGELARLTAGELTGHLDHGPSRR